MIIDVHSHFWVPDRDFTPDFRAQAKRAKGGVDFDLSVRYEDYRAAATHDTRTIVFGGKARLSGLWIDDQYIADYVAQDPKRLIGYLSIDPTQPGWQDELRHGHETLKLRGIKLLPMYAGFRPADEELEPLWQYASQHALPVLLHTGDPCWSYAKLRYAHPLTVDEVVVDHPRTTFVLVHAGNPWFETAAVIADKNPNAYLEASALLEGDLASLPPERVERHVVAPIGWLASYMTRPYKLMFGSGWPMVSLPAMVCGFSWRWQCWSRGACRPTSSNLPMPRWTPRASSST